MRHEPGTIFSVKIRDDLFTLTQSRENHLFEFFDIRGNNEEWKGVDLNKVKSIFCIYVASSKMRKIFKKIGGNVVVPNSAPTERMMLNAWPVTGQKYSSVVSLIKLPESFDSVDGIVVKENLLPDKDENDLRRYELTAMVGDPEKLKERLSNFFENGINWDKTKDFIFKGDLKP